MKKSTVVLVGAGGYGASYLSEITDPEVPTELVGIVDVFPENIKNMPDGVMCYPSLEAFYAEHKADIVVVSSPLHYHFDNTKVALENGSYVLCEKPLCATLEQANDLVRLSEKYNKLIMVGYQLCLNEKITEAKKDILNGKFGKPISAKTKTIWKREPAYYNRCDWAGKIQVHGLPVNDNVVSNATSHYLHNMLFLLGDKPDSATEVSDIKAKLFKARDIETFDTAFLSLKAKSKDSIVDVYMYASHAASDQYPVNFEIHFEKGVLFLGDDDILRFEGAGFSHIYGEINVNNVKTKIKAVIEYVQSNIPPVCHAKTTIPHMTVVDFLAKQEVTRVPDGFHFDEIINKLYDKMELEE